VANAIKLPVTNSVFFPLKFFNLKSRLVRRSLQYTVKILQAYMTVNIHDHFTWCAGQKFIGAKRPLAVIRSNPFVF